jgi:hypothetical protein
MEGGLTKPVGNPFVVNVVLNHDDTSDYVDRMQYEYLLKHLNTRKLSDSSPSTRLCEAHEACRWTGPGSARRRSVACRYAAIR